jgi:adenosyl cobinamide kinase/adenosyl cobinamide phosphate guanylyltransferase
LSVTLLLGGVRSGKSSLAVRLGQAHDGGVVFVATAEPFDSDLRDRVQRHRAERPPWPTVEAPLHLAAAVNEADPTAMVIVDCLTVWVGSLFHHYPFEDQRAAEYEQLIAALAARRAPTVVVSNEVGMGVHPESDLGRRYRDELGLLNQMVAALAATALLMVAGRALRLHDSMELL